jgi:hypothetical protein
MLTNRFKAIEGVVAQLPPDQQDALAAALEDALKVIQASPAVSAEVRAAMDRALERHTASLQYLKDK